MKDERKEELRWATIEAILYALDADIDGGELLMKEVWEDCSTGSEERVCISVLRGIKKVVKSIQKQTGTNPASKKKE